MEPEGSDSFAPEDSTMTRRRTEKEEPLEEDLEPLSPELIRELKARMKDADSPIRFMVVSRLTSKWRLFFDVSNGTYCADIETGTLFKRRAFAEAIAESLRDGRDGSHVAVAKVTTKNGKIRVVRYGGRPRLQLSVREAGEEFEKPLREKNLSPEKLE